MYTITDTVETGYFPSDGGTIDITIELPSIPTNEYRDKILEVIDYLDHCSVTDNEKIVNFSNRFFLLDKTRNIFEDVITVLYNFLQKDYKCTVKIGKESFTDTLKFNSKILKYNTEG